MNKVCLTCQVLKTAEAFGARLSRKDGLRSQCKTCEAAYRKANRDSRAESLRAWREENKEHVLSHQREYRAINKEVISGWSKAARERNPERYKATSIASRAKSRTSLGDAYLRPLLAPGGKGQVPSQLIELKRLELKIKREVKRQLGQ